MGRCSSNHRLAIRCPGCRTATQPSSSAIPCPSSLLQSHPQLPAPQLNKSHSYISPQKRQLREVRSFNVEEMEDLLRSRRIFDRPPHVHGIILLYTHLATCWLLQYPRSMATAVGPCLAAAKSLRVLVSFTLEEMRISMLTGKTSLYMTGQGSLLLLDSFSTKDTRR